MPVLLWDASALAKRYVPELGNTTVDALFASTVVSSMLAATLGYAETFSILLRKRNRGEIRPATFFAARTAAPADIPSFLASL